MADARLQVRSLSKSYGGVHALQDITLDFDTASITGLVGPNGAGKTTLLNTISGHARATSGSVLLDGVNVTRASAHRRARRGLSRTFQNLELGQDMSILDSTLVGAYDLLRRRRDADGNRFGRPAALARAHEVLSDCGLIDRVAELPRQLSYGQRKMVELARVAMSRSSVVLLDEQFAGLSMDERIRMAATIRAMPENGTTVVIIDHDVQTIFELVGSVAVLNFGRLIAHGTPDAVSKDPAVLEAYLGVGE